MQTEIVKCEDLSFDPANVRKHNDRNLDAIKASLRRFGQQKPIVVDQNDVVRAGNGTLQAAKSLGWEEISIVRTELETAEATAFAIADNRTSELAEWDDPKLAEQLSSLKDQDASLLNDIAFTAEELDRLMDNSQREVVDESIEIVEKKVADKSDRCQHGQLWRLGRHRLLIGDCRNDDDVKRLFESDKATIAFTSPPYASQRKYDEETEFKPIHPDEYVDWFEDVQANVARYLTSDGSWFVNIKEHCEDGQRTLYVKDLTISHVRRWNWRFNEEWVWKHGGTPKKVSKRFKNAWEPVFQFTLSADHKFKPQSVARLSDGIPAKRLADTDVSKRQGARAALSMANGENVPTKVGLALPSNVVSCGTNRESLGHAAAFPVALPEFFIRCHTDERDIVYEPFCGSGSTLMAAHNTSRTCFAIEISPVYCEIIIKRWEEATGQQALLDGQSQ